MAIRTQMVALFNLVLTLLLLAFGPLAIVAKIPPHPSVTMTSARRLADNYPYKTRLLNPDLCASESAELCKEMDKDLIAHADRTRALVETTGNLKVLVLLLQFDDHRNRTLVDTQDIVTLFNDDEKTPVAPTGSIKSYLKINSYDALNIDATVVPWFPIGKTEEYCTFGKSGLDRRFQECVQPILDALDLLHADAGHFFDWSDYDQNGDAYIDSVVVMTSSYGAEWGGTDKNGKGENERIWSHSIGPQSIRWQSDHFDVELGSYCVTSAFSGFQGSAPAPIGLVLHEMIHTFGIPDLFDMSRSDQKGGVGSYSIMSNAWGTKGDASFPGHLDPWSKIQLGWVTPKEITFNGIYEMEASESKPDIYIIDAPYPDQEYLLIENRQLIHFDEHLWTSGALIWHIDDSVPLNTDAGGPYQDGWPQNGNHYRVALAQADGLFELEQGLNKGHADDFYNGGTSLGPGTKNGNKVYPNTDAYQNGRIIDTNVWLGDFIEFGLSVFFTVNGLADSDNGPTLDLPGPTVELPPTQNDCMVRVNTQLCSKHEERIVPEEGCDCYNVCGNGVGQTCCAFGESCHINCHAGGLIAGCTLDDDETTSESGTPTDPGTPQQGAQEILIERIEDDDEDASQEEDPGSGATTLGSLLSSVCTLLAVNYLMH